ncbi:hypothetical protein ACFLY7_02650 [Patescibacteria group bacterium]
MKKILNLHKEIGETPLERIEKFKKENLEYRNVKMCYAGRLDPMAEGVLLVLVGEECKKKEEYLGLDKEYIFEVLFGFESDTYDILGLAKVSKSGGLLTQTAPKPPTLKSISQKLLEFKGKHNQEYPPFSSKTQDNKGKKKPLFQLAKEGILAKAKIPKKEIEIHNITQQDYHFLKKEEIAETIKNKIDLVKGDFRQKEILERWQKVLKETNQKEFLVVKIKMNCTSGTYARSVAHNLGKKLNTPSLAWGIRRTKVRGLTY